MLDSIASRIGILFAALVFVGCERDVNIDYEILNEKGLQCPDGAKLEYQPWGGKPTGVIAICKMDHGPYAISRNGVLIEEGESWMGKPAER